MGNLLRFLSKDENLKYDLFVDFENAQPTDSEKEIYLIVENVLFKTQQILYQLQTYKGAGNEIREAISNSHNKHLQIKAWNTVTPLVHKLKDFYQFSTQLGTVSCSILTGINVFNAFCFAESIIPKLLGALTSRNMTPRQHLETQQSLVKQFADILDFVLKFDDLKMTNPSIQNDFSYYRRTLGRQSVVPIENQIKLKHDHFDLSNEMANRMSLFYAQATPMLKVLSDCITKFVETNKDLAIENTIETLSTMAKVCQRMVENSEFCARFKKEDTIFFVIRVMVGVIILYDHVHPQGAFAKSSNIDIKGSIKLLNEQSPELVEGLLNALRYTTKHLNDESTPRHIKNLLA